MNKRNFFNLLLCYLIWGSAALYWNLFPEFNAVFKVACRVLFSALFGLACLAVTKKLYTIKEAFSDRKRIGYIAGASLSIGANWLIYVWALTNGYVVDASLGNYMGPVILSVLSVLIFKEKIDKLQIVSLGFILIGIVVSIIAYGSFPFVGLLTIGTFTAYTLFKKKANIDGLTGTTLETGLLSPLALAYIVFFRGEGGFDSVNSVWTAILLISTGAYTAIPFILYASGVNHLSPLIVGLAGMLTPTVVILTGILFLNETFTPASFTNFICVLIAQGLFIWSIVRKQQREKAAAEKELQET